MLRLWIILGSFWSGMCFADSSIFHEIAVLRFGQERIVTFQNGTLDLSSLKDNEYFHAQGEVYFVPGEFLTPQYLDEAAFGSWLIEKKAIKAELRLKIDPTPQAGTNANFGTYVLRFHTDRPRRLALAVPRLYHPMEIHYVDSMQRKRLMMHGTLDTNPKKNHNSNDMSIDIPVLEVDGDFYLFEHASSPVVAGRNILNISSFYVGEEHYIHRLVYQSRYYAILISGTFLIIFIFYFFIYSFRPQDHSSAYLCFYALCCFALSIIYNVNLPLTNFQILKVFTVINIFGITFLQCFLLDKLAFLGSRRRHWTLVATSFLISATASLGVILDNVALTGLCFVASFASSIALILTTLYLGIKHRLSGVSFFFFGAVLNLTFQYPIMEIYILRTNSELGYSILIAHGFMVLGLALVNAKEFAVTYRKSLQQSQALEIKNKEITFFNKNLEKLVDNKTREVRSLLDYIPQGVLSLKDEGLISKDFSAHLIRILGTQEIAQQSFKTLFLDQCVMSSDIRDQAWQSILSIVGESELNFDTNADKLPLEFVYRRGTAEKFLRATWNVDIESDIVVRLLVTLFDASAEREFQKESEKQRKELLLIQELINVPAGKVLQFFSTSLPLLKENERIISQTLPLSHSSIRMLFVNAHTVKGAARTLQFRELARQIHEMEEYYAHVLKENGEPQLDILRQDLAASLDMMNRYMDINRNKLNRADNYSKVVIERDFIEKHYFFIRGLVDDPPEMENMIDWLREQNETLTRMIFEQLPAIFDGYKERAVKIAKDLGKAEPRFEFNIDDISIQPDQKTALDNCMVHLLRNALDHGIESPAERTRKGKPEHGCIRIVTDVSASELMIRISDDGRGLAIQKLRDKGMALGILTQESGLQEVADAIFASGISTAHAISEISGRGVGMSAAQTFTERVGGSIHVRLGEPKDAAREFYDFWFEIRFQLGQMPLARVS